jgi:hypothetical protein
MNANGGISDEDSWYNIWHRHFDGYDIGDFKTRYRRQHIKAYLRLLEQAIIQAAI